jgi:hypothetical protein
VRELPGSSGKLSPCLPDDGAPRRGCRRPALACSSIPADRDHRFRRSGAQTGYAARAAPPLFACGMRARAVLVVLAWSGDGSPVWGCTTTSGTESPLGHSIRASDLRLCVSKLKLSRKVAGHRRGSSSPSRTRTLWACHALWAWHDAASLAAGRAGRRSLTSGCQLAESHHNIHSGTQLIACDRRIMSPVVHHPPPGPHR